MISIMMMPRWLAAFTAVSSLMITGCSATTAEPQVSTIETPPTARATPTITASADAPPQGCIEYVPSQMPNPDGGDAIAAAAATAVLPSDVILNPGVQVVTSVDEPGMLEAVARVCSEPMTEVKLIEIATAIAAAIYADPSHVALSTLTVSSWHPAGQQLEQGETVRVDDYQLYLWDNTTGALKSAWQ